MKSKILLIIILGLFGLKSKGQAPIPYLYPDSTGTIKGFWINSEVSLPAPGGGTYYIANGSFTPLSAAQVNSLVINMNIQNPEGPFIINGGGPIVIPDCFHAKKLSSAEYVQCGPIDRILSGVNLQFCVTCKNVDNIVCRGRFNDGAGPGQDVIVGGCGN